MPAFSSISTRAGVRDINNTNLALAQEDLAGKIAYLISAVNILNTTVSLIQAATVSANASGVTFSALSGVTFTATMATLSNFRA